MASDVIMGMVRAVEMPTLDGHLAFVAYLKFAHGIMRASRRLMEVAIEKSTGALREYYSAHLVEERDHAEWMARDIALLGAQPDLVDHAAAATAGAQYYYLEHVGPHALLGYIAALEFRPVPLAQVDALEKLYGPQALRTLRHHATHDPDHAKELARVIDQHIEFAPLIIYNASVTAQMLAFYLTEKIKLAGGAK